MKCESLRRNAVILPGKVTDPDLDAYRSCTGGSAGWSNSQLHSVAMSQLDYMKVSYALVIMRHPHISHVSVAGK